jgi:DNA polymerase-3 subunit alpha
MAEFGKYGFGMSHSYSYSILAYWTSWLKSHYPVDILTAICSTLKDKDRIPVYVTEARRMGIAVHGPDVNHHARGFAAEPAAIRYGLDAIKGVGAAAIAPLERNRPYADWTQVAAVVNKGVLRALAVAGAMDSVAPSRRALVRHIDADRDGDLVRCVHKDAEVVGAPNGLPCTFDWSSEQPLIRVGKRGQSLKPEVRAVPKKCMVSCRRYQPPVVAAMSAADRYEPDYLWRLETEAFGTWITPGAFEAMDAAVPGARSLCNDVAAIWDGLPEGDYQVPAVMAGLRETRTRTGKPMAWLTLASELGFFDMVVFMPRSADDGPDLIPVLRVIPPGVPVVAYCFRQRYQSKGAWRTSARLLDVRRL